MSLNKILLKNGTLYLNKEFIKKDILIENGIIKEIDKKIMEKDRERRDES